MPGTRTRLAAAAAVALAFGPATATEGFRAIQEACKGQDAARIEKVLPAASAEGIDAKGAEAVAAWRRDLAGVVAGATLVEAREAGDAAVVRCSTGKTEIELILARAGDAWIVGAPFAYLVKGPVLDGANGRTPAATRLAARTANEAYGTSGWSFAHVTSDVAKCAGRIDLWYCHNGDLHGCGDAKICRVRAKDLASVNAIPAGAAWKDTLAPEAGGIYVLRCRRKGLHDFYVKFRVAAADAKRADLAWSILAAGQGTPGSIHSPHPAAPGEPGAAFDGLCAKNRDRSKPEPLPPETGTATPK
jgi:hypothetical protein